MKKYGVIKGRRSRPRKNKNKTRKHSANDSVSQNPLPAGRRRGHALKESHFRFLFLTMHYLRVAGEDILPVKDILLMAVFLLWVAGEDILPKTMYSRIRYLSMPTLRLGQMIVGEETLQIWHIICYRSMHVCREWIRVRWRIIGIHPVPIIVRVPATVAIFVKARIFFFCEKTNDSFFWS